MNIIDSTKTLVGTLEKYINEASVYGKSFDLTDLYLIKIINDYNLNCSSNLCKDVNTKLNELVIKIVNKNKNICVYRTMQNNYVNIKGDNRILNINNSTIKVVNTPPEVDDETVEL